MLSLQEQIAILDPRQGERFSKIKGVPRNIAIEGIRRHFKACRKIGCNPDASAIREIIDDAMNGRRIYSEVNNDHLMTEPIK